MLRSIQICIAQDKNMIQFTDDYPIHRMLVKLSYFNTFNPA